MFTVVSHVTVNQRLVETYRQRDHHVGSAVGLVVGVDRGLGAEVDYVRLLSDGDIDLVIANWVEPPEHLHLSKLFEDKIVCAMRADNPYAKRTESNDMTIEDYLKLPHIAPS